MAVLMQLARDLALVSERQNCFRILAGLFNNYLFTFSRAQEFFFRGSGQQSLCCFHSLPLVYRKGELTFAIKEVATMGVKQIDHLTPSWKSKDELI